MTNRNSPTAQDKNWRGQEAVTAVRERRLEDWQSGLMRWFAKPERESGRVQSLTLRLASCFNGETQCAQVALRSPCEIMGNQSALNR